MIVENKVGAGGHIATEFVARAKPDGHTIYVFAATGAAAMAAMFKNPPVDVSKTIQVAATINRQPFMLVVDAKSPYKTVKELTDAMKAKGDKATYASAAPPGTIMGEIYKQKTGVQAVEVNYKTAPDSLNELTSGKLDYGMHDPVFSLAQQREGRLKILAVSTGERLQASPDLPTMKESGVDMDMTIWWAAMVPQGTPKPIVDQINKWFSADRLDGRHQEVPEQLRRRPVHQLAGEGAGDVPQGDPAVDRVREDREASSDVTKWARRHGRRACSCVSHLWRIR